MSYDIIGDIHGHAEKLAALLAKLGYRQHMGAWRHPQRTAIFVGDFIDRGPGQLATLDIVRRMVDCGSAQAVMGNHEFNAIAWYLPDPIEEGMHLRVRNKKNRHQHEAFLTEVEADHKQHREIVEWFMSLPLWLDLPDLRVIHACWHTDYISELQGHLGDDARLNKDVVEAASRRDSLPFKAIEVLTKGLEIELPEGVSFLDEDGHERCNVRSRWWDQEALTYRQAALISRTVRERLPELPIPPSARIGYANDKPLFVGHYWHSGPLQPLTPYIACVDYSVGKGGPLVAYRWEGESVLSASQFVATN